ncbi:hypothetical protein [Alsobacter soli]|nr:hypothetical protein [Alsobacter soli]
MKSARRFLVSPALARLARKERGISDRSVIGYFQGQSDRQQAVEIGQQSSTLVLITKDGDGPATEERFDVPRRHAEALLESCAARIGFERTRMDAGGRMVQITRLLTSQPVELIDVEFAEGEDPSRFWPPAWFGPEVTDDQTWSDRALAMEGLPSKATPQANETALSAFLDDIEGIGALQRFTQREPAERKTVPASERKAAAAAAAGPNANVVAAPFTPRAAGGEA